MKNNATFSECIEDEKLAHKSRIGNTNEYRSSLLRFMINKNTIECKLSLINTNYDYKDVTKDKLHVLGIVMHILSNKSEYLFSLQEEIIQNIKIEKRDEVDEFHYNRYSTIDKDVVICGDKSQEEREIGC